MTQSDDEIRLKIAELKGWVEVEEDIVSPTRNGLRFSYTAKFWQPPDGNTDGREPPFWAENPAAALELVEEMRDTKNVIVFGARSPANVKADKESGAYDDSQWYCGIQRNGPERGPDWGYSDTFCRAVCVAYIAWKEAAK